VSIMLQELMYAAIMCVFIVCIFIKSYVKTIFFMQTLQTNFSRQKANILLYA